MNWKQSLALVVVMIIGSIFFYQIFIVIPENQEMMLVANRCWNIGYSTGSHKPVPHCYSNEFGMVMLQDAYNFPEQSLPKGCGTIYISESNGLYEGSGKCMEAIFEKRNDKFLQRVAKK